MSAGSMPAWWLEMSAPAPVAPPRRRPVMPIVVAAALILWGLLMLAAAALIGPPLGPMIVGAVLVAGCSVHGHARSS